MYVAFDDTDSTTAMCTTFLATEVVRAMSQYDVIGLPRLVRLNPSVPWKTRGNGALCLRLGRGGGERTVIGRIGDEPVHSCRRCLEPADEKETLDTCSRLLDLWSRIDEDASPGLVVSAVPPSSALYWEAVRRVVDKGSVEEELERIGARTYQLGGGRGVIGAAAAMSWRPRDRTYETLVYRERSKWGQPRQVCAEDVARLDGDFPSTFNNFDHEAGRTAIVPHSSCPILFGVRGDEPRDTVEAAASIRSERKDRWMLFMSNQGTDDHVIRRWRWLEPWSSYQVRGKVVGLPRTIPGGHVILRLQTKGGMELDSAAYEPSKEFRAIFRHLLVGDRVTMVGELREEPRTLNVEKMRIEALVERRVKVSNPVCPSCGKSMQSLGKAGGYRCRRCRAKSTDAGRWEACPRPISLGWYEPPVRSRRHISKPLKRMGGS